MTRPALYILRIAMFLACVAAAGVFCRDLLEHAFMANPWLNGLIVSVLGVGIIAGLRQIVRLYPEINWVTAMRAGKVADYDNNPVLLAPMARLLGDDGSHISVSPTLMRTLLDSVAARLHETRETTRYLIGLLVFLGLLGTFWGLLHTVGAVGNVVGGLAVPDGGDMTKMLGALKSGLEAPLKGMATAFSSSLLGLAGSLILGFVDLQAGHAQGRFFTEVEDWLAETTSISHIPATALANLSHSSHNMGSGSALAPAQITALIGQLAEQLDQMQRQMRLQEETRQTQILTIDNLADKLGALAAQMKVEQELILKLANTQMRMEPLFQQLTDAAQTGRLGIDDITRQHIRNMDTHIGRLADQAMLGRGEIITEMRHEIRLLGRTITALVQEDEPPSRSSYS